MACNENSNTPWGENVDFETRYTGDNIECGDQVIIAQGESLRTIIQTLADRSCDTDVQMQELSNGVAVATTKADEATLEANTAYNTANQALQNANQATSQSSQAIDAANQANLKADKALNEIANLPEVLPTTLGLNVSKSIPTRGTNNTWQSGLVYDEAASQNTIARRYTGGRLRVGAAIDDSDAVTLAQLNEASFETGVKEDNIGNSFVSNSTRSLVMKSDNSSIDLVSNSTNQSNLILGSKDSKMLDVTRFNSIISSDLSIIRNGFNQSIIASSDCEIKGAELPSVTFAINHNRAIIASSESVITGMRENTVAIASHRAVFEEYTVQNQSKWNVAVIAGRECKVKASNSYTIVTGQGTVSNASAQLVIGTFNLDEPSVSVFSPNKKIFVVGNGIANSYAPDGTPQDIVRNNAFEVKNNGEAWVQNGIEVGEAGKGIIMKSPNGQKWLLSVDNDGNPVFTSV